MKKALGILWKTVKWILIVVAVLVALILCGALGPIVKWTAPVVANCMGAKVSLEECSILPLGGYVRIGGLRVENPKAFREQNADLYNEQALAEVGNLELDFAVLSLFGEEYVVDKIELTGLRALYAFDYGTTNVDALVDEMGLKPKAQTEAEVADTAPVETPEAPETPATDEKAKAKKSLKHARLAYVKIADNSVTVRKFINLPITIPPVELVDTNTRDLIAKINETLAPLYQALRGLGNGLASSVDVVGEGVNAATDTVTEGVDAAATTVTDGLGAATEVLSGGLQNMDEASVESLKEIGKATVESLKDIGKGSKDSLKNFKNPFDKK